MPIKQTTPNRELEISLDAKVSALRQALIYNLEYVGEQVVNRARNTSEKGHDFTDRTGNLRSSIGYVITVDGQIVSSSDFRPVLTGNEGSGVGQSFAKFLAQQFPTGIALVVVAGMSYAGYVAARGFDVLDSSQELAKRLVPRMLDKLKLK